MMREIRMRLLTRLWVVLARVGAVGGAFVLELSPRVVENRKFQR